MAEDIAVTRSIMERVALEPALQALFAASRQRILRKQQVVIDEGSKADSLFLILTGTVALTTSSGEEEQLLGFKVAGEFFGEMGMFPDQKSLRSARVSARGECTVLEIGYDRFRALAQEHPRLWEEIAWQLARDLRSVTRRIAAMHAQLTGERVWRVLVDLALHFRRSGSQHEVEVRVTRADLGKLAACSRELAGSTLHELARSGKVELKGHSILVRLQR